MIAGTLKRIEGVATSIQELIKGKEQDKATLAENYSQVIEGHKAVAQLSNDQAAGVERLRDLALQQVDLEIALLRKILNDGQEG